MKRVTINRLLAPENLFAAAYFLLLATILLYSDPEWILWAGPITLGAFPVTAAPPLPFEPFGAFRVAAGGAMLGLLAFIVLLSANGAPRKREGNLHKPARTC